MTEIDEFLSGFAGGVSASDVVGASVHHLIDGGLLAAFRNRIQSAPELLDLSRASYLHENQFCKLTLGTSRDNRFRLRLHLWQPTPGPQPDANIHNHRFAFASCVLRGRLDNMLWKMDDDGAVFRSFAYQPRSGADDYVMQYRGTKQLMSEAPVTHDDRRLYAQEANLLHTSQPQDTCVTLFVEDRIALRTFADVYSDRYPATTFTIHSPSLPPHEFADRLDSIIRVIR